MNIKRIVGEKGQVVVPKDIRDHLGIKPGSSIMFEVKENEVVIKPTINPREFVEDFCNVPKKLKKLDINKLKGLVEEEYDLP